MNEDRKSKLKSLKNLLIVLNNSDIMYIKQLNETSISSQESYLNSKSFNLYKNGNDFVKNILNIIFYGILKKRTEKELFSIAIEYESKILAIKDRIKKRTKQIENIKEELKQTDLGLEYNCGLTDEEIKTYLYNVHKFKK